MLNEDNEADHWVSIERETTDHHRYEEEISRSRGQYYDLVDDLNCVICSIEDQGIARYLRRIDSA